MSFSLFIESLLLTKKWFSSRQISCNDSYKTEDCSWFETAIWRYLVLRSVRSFVHDPNPCKTQSFEIFNEVYQFPVGQFFDARLYYFHHFGELEPLTDHRMISANQLVCNFSDASARTLNATVRFDQLTE